MRKKMSAALCAMALFCTAVIPQTGARAAEPVGYTAGTTYYVSTLHGRDANNGLSEKTPFYSIQKINDLTLEPGDRILLECGSIFTDGYLHLFGQSGSEEQPIVIDKYGEGALPVLDTNGEGIWYQNYGFNRGIKAHKFQGYVSSSILLYDSEYIEINNLELVNRAPDIENVYNEPDVMNRTGVAAVAQDGGTLHHIFLNGLYVHDVIGNVYDKHMNNGGIYFTQFQPHDLTEEGTTGTGIPRYDGVRIENCVVENVNRWGIAVGYTAFGGEFGGAAIDDEVVAEYGSANVVIRNNYVKDPGGDAITTMYCDRPLVEYNISDAAARQINSVDYTKSTNGGKVAAAIWPWKCKDAVFQYNEAFDTHQYGGDRDNGDGQAWDADYGDGTLYQYNYSHHNEGGCIMVCGKEAYRTTFRYNISQNDLRGALDIPDSNLEVHVYNNVFYMAENVPFIRTGRTNYGFMMVENNIIYYAGDTPRTEKWTYNATREFYNNNLYYNYANIPESDENPIVVEAGTPVFQNAGSGPEATTGIVFPHGDARARSVFDGYKLAKGSPAIGAGIRIEDRNGMSASEKDFFGNDLSDVTVFDVGAHQYQENEEPGVPAAPQRISADASETSVTLRWTPVQDDTIPIAGYRVSDGDKILADVQEETTVEIGGLEPGKEYTLSVVAYDVQGYESEAQTITFRTAGMAGKEEEVGKSRLRMLLETAKGLRASDYTPESWKWFQTAWKDAEAVMANGSSTKTAVDVAALKFTAAMKGLQKVQMTLDRTSAVLYTKGKRTLTLKVKTPQGSGTVSWSSSNPKAASVKNGKVTAKKAGKTVITASAGEKKAVCTITVKKPTLKITGRKTITLKKGKKVKIKAKALPAGKMTWKSSNQKVATVTSKGVVKGRKEGKSRITVSCNGVQKKVWIKVKIR